MLPPALSTPLTTVNVLILIETDTTLLLLFNLQARIAELEEELEAERASRTKVSSYL